MKQNIASRRQRRKEKEALRPGPRECKAGHETNNYEEFRVRWRKLCTLGKGGQNTGEWRWVLQTQYSPQKTEKDREREGWDMIKSV